MAIINPTLPTIGEPRGDGETDVRNALNTIVSEVNDKETAFSTWKPILRVGATNLFSLSTTLRLLQFNPAGSAAAVSNTPAAAYGFTLDPADFTAGSRITQYRLRLTVSTNAVAPAVDFIAQLHAVSSVTATAGNDPFITAVSAVGSAATVSAPTANGGANSSGAAFTAPAAGFYTVGIKAASGTMAVNSAVGVQAELMYRQT